MSSTLNLIYVSSLGLTITDGTVAGTRVITASSGSFGQVTDLVSWGDDVFFVAASSLGNNELWETDGTTAGTSRIVALPASGDGDAGVGGGLTVVGGNVVFDYGDGGEPDYGSGMWVSDGTAAGTAEVPGGFFAEFSDEASIGTDLIFKTDSGLAETDGTVGGTQVFYPDGSQFAVGYSMASLGTKVVFDATSSPATRDDENDNEIWVSDGTATGTTHVITLPDNTSPGGLREGQIGGLVSIGSKALFEYEDGSGSVATLWVTDGTATGTFELSGITAPRISDVLGAMSANGYVFTSSQGLDVSDGTVAGTTVIVPEVDGPGGFIPSEIMATLGNDIVFAASDSGTFYQPGAADEIWITDGTAAGTKLITTLSGGQIGSMTSLGDQVVFTNFTVNDGIDDNAVWVTDGTAAGTSLVQDAASTSLTGALIEAACFLAGTLIATQAGEVPVERLSVGDPVMTLCGAMRPITWIGVGRVIVTRGCRNAATPVIVRKNAFADNVPHSDLRVTKGHAFHVDGALIPVEFLVNHRSILWDDHAQEVTFYHIELDSHDVLLANGAPAESYRDDGNRWLFQNSNSGWNQVPQEPCARVLTGGPVVDTVWLRLLQRSGPRRNVPLTKDPDLHLLIDGRRLDAAENVADVCVFRVPAVPLLISIVSRAAVPAELGLARDPRLLGVALRRLVVRKGSQFRSIDAKDHRLTDGFHDFEDSRCLRWTDGAANVPIGVFDGFVGPFEVVLHIGATCHYPAEGPVQRVA